MVVIMEKAIPVPLTGEEIIEVIVQQARKRLQSLSPLQGNKEYAAFTVRFSHDITLFPISGEVKSTLAWGDVKDGQPVEGVEPVKSPEQSQFESGNSPNAVREDHDLPLTVEVPGKGGVTRKKVKVSKAA